MAGLAQSMMNCTAVRANASSFMAGSPLTSVSSKSVARMVPVTRISAVKTPEECNEEECAPTKEVGKLSMDWKTEDNLRVTGTYPPITRTERKWTGYVEKDTAGQTNIYAVEPTIYVAESAISTGAAGSNSGGSESILAVVGGIGVVAIAGAAAVLLTASSNTPAPATSYVGPPLSYYVSKFSQETAASTLSAQIVPPVPESPPLAEDLSISQPEVAVADEARPEAAVAAEAQPEAAVAAEVAQ